MNRWALVLFFLISVEITSAAVIYGSIYDISLNKVSDVRVEINTAPKQQYVAKNSSYSFNVPVGDYSILAVHYTGSIVEISRENISVKDEGTYVLDLILFPSYEEEKELLKETGMDITVDANKEENRTFYYIISSLLVVIIGFLVYALFRKKKPKEAKPEAEQPKEEKKTATDLDEIIKIIKEEGGRTTQKEIRKRIPLSEAKISLMITELESKGAIKKIKKGRGNILILSK